MDARIATILDSLDNDEGRADELAGLTDEQLAALIEDLRATGREVRGDGSPETVTPEVEADLNRIVAAVRTLRDEQTRRTEAAAEEAAEAAARAERAAAAVEELGDDPDNGDDGEGEASSEDEGGEETEAEAEGDHVLEPATASAPPRTPTLAAMAALRPRSADPEPTTRITDVRPRWQFEGGASTLSQDELAERMAAAANDFVTMPPGVGMRIPVARLHVEYPPEQSFARDDGPAEQAAKLHALTRDAKTRNYTEEQAAIVAAGGFCAPSQPRYDIYSVVSARRPVRAGLVNVGVPRGALTYVQGARLSTINTSGAGAAVTLWTEATDLTPGETVKTAQIFTCRTPVDRTLQAIVAQVQFGNFEARAFPELVADDLALVMAAHARVAERALLDSIISQINIDVAQTGFFGTARDVKQVLMQAQAQLRYVERSDTPARAIIERTILPMIVQDVTFQAASGSVDALYQTEADAQRLVATSGVNVTYAMDTSTGPDEIVSNSDAGAQNLADYPDTFEIPIFFDGSVAFLDGGTLDLGIVRDSTLNSTNDYQIFMETFEEAAYFGPFGLTLTLTTCPTGYSQVTKDATTICSGS